MPNDVVAGFRGRTDVLEPGMVKAAAALADVADPIQAYCDLLEVRWLLRSGEGRDVGEEAALAALAARKAPSESAARWWWPRPPRPASPGRELAAGRLGGDVAGQVALQGGADGRHHPAAGAEASGSTLTM